MSSIKNRATAAHQCTLRPLFESLEGRSLLSVAVATTAISPIATTTTLKASTSSLVIGQSLSVTVKVKPVKGTRTPRGTIQLLDNGKKTGITATLNHLSYTTFRFDPGQAIFVGKYGMSARFISGSSSLVGSKSKTSTIQVTAPKLTTLPDGLQEATVTAGSGKAIASGQAFTGQYTGFYASSGSVFDNSAAHAPGTFTFTLNASPEQVITGFDEGATGMKVGETRVLVIPAALGYKDGQVRIFILHLNSFK